MNTKSDTKALVIASLIFIAIIAAGLITTQKPEIEYMVNAQKTLEALQNSNHEISPFEVVKSANENSNKFICVDLRSQYDFNKGNITGSVNIPANRILEKESLDFLKSASNSSSAIVLYDNSISQTTGTWMILLQLGFDNVKILQGGWDFYTKMDLQNPDKEPLQKPETARYNYAKMNETSGQNSVSTIATDKKEKVVPEKKIKTKVVEGGC